MILSRKPLLTASAGLAIAAIAALLLWPNSGPPEAIAARLCDRAEAALERGDNILAQKVFHEASRVDSTSSRALLGTAEALIARRLFADALSALRKAGSLAGRDADVWERLGRFFTDARAPDEALAAFRQALAISPARPRALVLMANVLLDAGSIPEAEDTFRRAEKLDRGAAQIHRGLGRLFLRSGRPDSAAGRFRATLQASPGDPESACGLAEALLRLGSAPEARDVLNDLVERDPYHVRARFLLGRAYMAMGKEERARAELEIFERQKHLSDRIGFLEKVQAENPTAEGYQMLAHLYSVRGRDSLATDRLRRATALDPMVTAPQITAQSGTF
jgi:Tfp pilus assembly protein PilF